MCVGASTALEVQSEHPAASTKFLSGYCNMVGLEADSFAYSNNHTITDSDYVQA